MHCMYTDGQEKFIEILYIYSIAHRKPLAWLAPCNQSSERYTSQPGKKVHWPVQT